MSRWLVTGSVAVAAVLAWFAPTEPTGVEWYDAGLRAATAAAVTFLAARASGGALAVGALLGAVGAATGSAVVALPAGAAAGLAVGLAATGHVPAPFRAAVGATVAVAAFHLAWPDAENLTAGLGTVALLVPAASGLRRLRPAGRRAALVGLAALAIVAVGAATLGAVAALQARSHLEAGANRAESGLAAARRGSVDQAARALDQASTSFSEGRRRLRPWWARPAVAVPVVAHQVRAATTLAATGAEVTRAAARIAAVSRPAELRVDGGVVPLDRIRDLVPPAAEASAVLSRGERRLAHAAAPWLVPPVRREVDRLRDRVERAGRDADTAARVARLAPGLLGGDGPRRWFLAVQSPAEQRGTGGFIGSFAELAADGGRLRLERVGRAADLNQGGSGRRIDGPPEYLARYGRFDPHLLWQNVNMSPDFPTVAGVIAGLYPQSGGTPVEGVIAVDPYGLAAILRAVGPVRVADWPEPITTDNAARVLLYEQYVRFPQSAERIDFLGQVTQAVWQRLTTGSFGIVDLGRALVDALDEKHVMLASTKADEQAVLADLDVAGAVAPVQDDFLGVVTQNAGGNKIDWFLRRAVDYRVQLDEATGQVEATARITLRNEAPADGLPAYIIGSALKPPLPRGTNRTFLTVYTPWAVDRATVDGRSVGMESERELGRRAYSAFVDVPPGGSVVVELHLRGTQSRAQAGYRVTLHRQPSVAADEVRVAVGPASRRLQLDRDRSLVFPVDD